MPIFVLKSPESIRLVWTCFEKFWRNTSHMTDGEVLVIEAGTYLGCSRGHGRRGQERDTFGEGVYLHKHEKTWG